MGDTTLRTVWEDTGVEENFVVAGRNNYGELGFGDRTERNVPTENIF